MKRAFSVSAVLFLLSIAVSASDSNGLLRGGDWLEMSTAERLIYIQGVHDVAAVSPIFIATKIQRGQEAAAKETLGALNDFVLTGLFPKEIVGALDGFYNDRSNVRIPILFAIRWAELKGSVRDAEAARLRATYPKDGKQ